MVIRWMFFVTMQFLSISFLVFFFPLLCLTKLDKRVYFKKKNWAGGKAEQNVHLCPSAYSAIFSRLQNNLRKLVSLLPENEKLASHTCEHKGEPGRHVSEFQCCLHKFIKSSLCLCSKYSLPWPLLNVCVCLLKSVSNVGGPTALFTQDTTVWSRRLPVTVIGCQLPAH